MARQNNTEGCESQHHSVRVKVHTIDILQRNEWMAFKKKKSVDARN